MHRPEDAKIISAIAAVELARGFGRYIVWIVMALYLYQVRGVPLIEIGAIYVVAGLVSSPFSLAGGKLIDRIGRRFFAVTLPVFQGISYALLFLFMYSGSPLIEILPAFIVLYPLTSLQYVNDSSIVSDTSLEHERMESFSKTRIFGNIGIGLGLLAGGIISGINYSYVFIVTLATEAIQEYIYLTRVPETRPLGSGNISSADPAGKIRQVHSDYLFVVFVVVAAVSSLASGQFESPMTPIFFESVYAFPVFFITVLYAVNTLVVIFVQRPINSVLSRMDDGRRITLGLGVFSISYIIFGLANDYLIIVAAVALLTVGENILVPALSTTISRMAPSDRRGTYFGFSSMVGSFIIPFTPLLGMFLLSVFFDAPIFIWGTISALGLSIGMLFLSISGKIRKREEAFAASL